MYGISGFDVVLNTKKYEDKITKEAPKCPDDI
jgi:hypothetical protein